MFRVILIGLVLVTTGLASYYRQQTQTYRGQLLLQQEAVAEPVQLNQQTTENADDTPSEVELMTTTEVEGSVPAMDERDLRVRIQELETSLRDRELEIRRLQRRLESPPANEAARPRIDRQEWLENLREDDPERYSQIIERRRNTQNLVNESFARKAAHFLYRDNSHLSEEDIAEHEYMVGLLGETWRLADQMHADSVTREERWQIGRQLMENVRELTPMMGDARDREFYDLALELGYDETGALDFVDYINEMIEVTTFGNIWRGQRREWRGE